CARGVAGRGPRAGSSATRGIATWPERLRWIASSRHPVDVRGSVPLAVYGQGCLYRNRAIHALEAAGRTWHLAYTSPNLPGILAAVSAGLGVTILPDVAIGPEHRVLGAAEGFPAIPNTELALVTAPGATPATRRLADVLANFCNSIETRQRMSRRSGGRFADKDMRQSNEAAKKRQPGRQRAAANV